MADSPPSKRELERILDSMARELKEDSRRKFKDLEDKFMYRWNIDEMQSMFRSLEKQIDTLERKIEDLAKALNSIQE